MWLPWGYSNIHFFFNGVVAALDPGLSYSFILIAQVSALLQENHQSDDIENRTK